LAQVLKTSRVGFYCRK